MLSPTQRKSYMSRIDENDSNAFPKVIPGAQIHSMATSFLSPQPPKPPAPFTNPNTKKTSILLSPASPRYNYLKNLTNTTIQKGRENDQKHFNKRIEGKDKYIEKLLG